MVQCWASQCSVNGCNAHFAVHLGLSLAMRGAYCCWHGSPLQSKAVRAHDITECAQPVNQVTKVTEASTEPTKGRNSAHALMNASWDNFSRRSRRANAFTTLCQVWLQPAGCCCCCCCCRNLPGPALLISPTWGLVLVPGRVLAAAVEVWWCGVTWWCCCSRMHMLLLLPLPEKLGDLVCGSPVVF